MIVVTGATGNVGQALVTNLAAAGQTVTAVSRGVTGTAAPERASVITARADLSDLASLAGTFTGAEALFLLVPGSGEDVDGPALMAAATAAGLRRVVLLSSQAVGTRPGAMSHAPFAALEGAVRHSGLEWTILRPGGLMSNALAWAPTIRAQRTVFTPYADVALPVVDPWDVADAAATALTDDAHAGRTYVLTGPRATTPRERAASIAAALGAAIDVVELTPDQAREQMTKVMPDAVAEGTLQIMGHPTAAEEEVSPHVSELVGRSARSFATWAARSADAFR